MRRRGDGCVRRRRNGSRIERGLGVFGRRGDSLFEESPHPRVFSQPFLRRRALERAVRSTQMPGMTWPVIRALALPRFGCLFPTPTSPRASRHSSLRCSWEFRARSGRERHRQGLSRDSWKPAGRRALSQRGVDVDASPKDRDVPQARCCRQIARGRRRAHANGIPPQLSGAVGTEKVASPDPEVRGGTRRGGSRFEGTRLRARGATDDELTDLVRGMQAEVLFSFCCLLENPGLEEASVADVAWALVQVDDSGAVLGTIQGLPESVLETDPTGREMRPRAPG